MNRLGKEALGRCPIVAVLEFDAACEQAVGRMSAAVRRTGQFDDEADLLKQRESARRRGRSRAAVLSESTKSE